MTFLCTMHLHFNLIRRLQAMTKILNYFYSIFLKYQGKYALLVRVKEKHTVPYNIFT